MEVIRNPCHKVPRIPSIINMLQNGLKEQTYEITGTHSAESAVAPAERTEALEPPVML